MENFILSFLIFNFIIFLFLAVKEFFWDTWVWFLFIIAVLLLAILIKNKILKYKENDKKSYKKEKVYKEEFKNKNTEEAKINNENFKYKDWKKENWYTEEYLDRFRYKSNKNKNSDLNLNFNLNKNNKESEEIKNNTKIKIKEVLNKSELNFYRQLKSYLDWKWFFIFSKVRLVDFLDLSKIKNFSERTSMFNKVSRKHIDFIITDLESNIRFLIELDWEYHYYDKKAIENDKFKNELFKEIWLKLIRFNVKNWFYDLRILWV